MVCFTVMSCMETPGAHFIMQVGIGIRLECWLNVINVFATNTGDNDLFPSRYLMHFKICFILNKQSSDNKLRNYFSMFVFCPKRLFIQSTKRSIYLYFPSDS